MSGCRGRNDNSAFWISHSISVHYSIIPCKAFGILPRHRHLVYYYAVGIDRSPLRGILPRPEFGISSRNRHMPKPRICHITTAAICCFTKPSNWYIIPHSILSITTFGILLRHDVCRIPTFGMLPVRRDIFDMLSSPAFGISCPVFGILLHLAFGILPRPVFGILVFSCPTF